MTSRFALTVLCIAWSLTGCLTAHAGILTINNPDTAYVQSTTLTPITQPVGTDLTSLTDGALTISFSHTREVHEIPRGGWSTWSAAPWSESSTPRVLSTDGYANLFSLTLTFSQPLLTFGVEAEPNSLSLLNFVATFHSNASNVGSISRQIHGFAGARLLAATAIGNDLFTSVTISSTDDFALAQFRYAMPTPVESVPEPSSLLIATCGGFGCWILRRLQK